MSGEIKLFRIEFTNVTRKTFYSDSFSVYSSQVCIRITGPDLYVHFADVNPRRALHSVNKREGKKVSIAFIYLGKTSLWTLPLTYGN